MAHQFDISKITIKPDDADSRKHIVDLARVAETAERYEDMCAFVKLICTKYCNGILTIEERNLLSVAYKNVIGARRASWRQMNLEEYKDDPQVTAYRNIIHKELADISKEVLDLINNVLIPATDGKKDESEVFYKKMAGDYNRYMAEVEPTGGYSELAEKFYAQALTVAENLSPTNPIRLGLALNYSVCFYEIVKDPKKACDLAKQAFDEAISKLDQLDESSYKDSTLIMQLLRDNLTLWTSDTAGDDDDEM